jgi:hypothetical protein
MVYWAAAPGYLHIQGIYMYRGLPPLVSARGSTQYVVPERQHTKPQPAATVIHIRCTPTATSTTACVLSWRCLHLQALRDMRSDDISYLRRVLVDAFARGQMAADPTIFGVITRLLKLSPQEVSNMKAARPLPSGGSSTPGGAGRSSASGAGIGGGGLGVLGSMMGQGGSGAGGSVTSSPAAPGKQSSWWGGR